MHIKRSIGLHVLVITIIIVLGFSSYVLRCVISYMRRLSQICYKLSRETRKGENPRNYVGSLVISRLHPPSPLSLSELGLSPAHFHVGWVKSRRASPAQFVQPNPSASPPPSAKSHAAGRRDRW